MDTRVSCGPGEVHKSPLYPCLTVRLLPLFVGAYHSLQSRNLVRVIRFAVFVSQCVASCRGSRHLWKRGNE